MSEPTKAATVSANEEPSGASGNGHLQSHAAHETVLIVSDDPDFARAIVARWQSERVVPAFTLVGSDLPRGAMSASCSLAILGPHAARQPALLQALEGAGADIVCVAESEASRLQASIPRALFVRHADGWLEVLVQLAAEILRRARAMRRMHQAVQFAAETTRHATLGRYVLEMRHTLNNCLTSVLGNAELLLLEPGRLNAEAREQVRTMHSMALRMHEILQRFSSLESEMRFAEASQSETLTMSHGL